MQVPIGSALLSRAGASWIREATVIGVAALLVARSSGAQQGNAAIVNEITWEHTAIIDDYLTHLSILVAQGAGEPRVTATYDDGTQYFGPGSDSTSVPLGSASWNSDSTSISSDSPFASSDSTSISSDSPFASSDSTNPWSFHSLPAESASTAPTTAAPNAQPSSGSSATVAPSSAASAPSATPEPASVSVPSAVPMSIAEPPLFVPMTFEESVPASVLAESAGLASFPPGEGAATPKAEVPPSRADGDQTPDVLVARSLLAAPSLPSPIAGEPDDVGAMFRKMTVLALFYIGATCVTLTMIVALALGLRARARSARLRLQSKPHAHG